MASGHPKFGGSNGVEALDLGQVGGTRATAGDALLSVQVHQDADRAAAANVGLPEQSAVYRCSMGYAGGRCRWIGTVRAKDAATLAAIVADLNKHVHGSARNYTTGELGAPSPSRIKESQLTDSDGNVLTVRAVIASWRPTTRVYATTGTWARIVGIEVEFEILG